MSETAGAAPDHGVVDGAPSLPPPLAATVSAPRLSPGEDPWASLVTYGALDNGAPVLCLSHLAEHGRNLAGDPRASLVITQVNGPPDPLAAARVTLAGRAERAADPATFAAARTAHLAGVPAAATYVDFSDFSLWVLHVERVRWVGGYGPWTPPRERPTRRQRPIRSQRTPPPRPPTSTTTTPTCYCASHRHSADTRTLPGRNAPA